jgi:hypothetical protein
MILVMLNISYNEEDHLISFQDRRIHTVKINITDS